MNWWCFAKDTITQRPIKFIFRTCFMIICILAWFGMANLQATDNNSDAGTETTDVSFQNEAQAQRAENIATQVALQDPDGKTIEEITEQIDIVEVLNARAVLNKTLAKARAFASKHDIAQSAGSDAHTPVEIGNAYVEMPEFNGRDDFLKSLIKGKIRGHKTTPLIHFASIWARIKNKLGF